VNQPAMPRPAAKAKEPSTDSPRDRHRLHRAEKTYQEWQEQPSVLQTTLNSVGEAAASMAAECARRPLQRVIVTGCGDSWIAGIGIRLAGETLLRVPWESWDALDFAAYGMHSTGPGTIVFGISASGTTDVVNDGLHMAKQRGAYTVGVTNTPGSRLTLEYDGSLVIPASRQGWPTQASTSAMAGMLLFAVELAKQRGASQGEAEQLETELRRLPELMQSVQSNCVDSVEQMAQQCVRDGVFQLFGAGPHLAVAGFGAAKLRELCPCLAMFQPLEEFHHYRTAKDNEPLIIVAPPGPSLQRAADAAEVARYDGGRVYGLTEQGDTAVTPFLEGWAELPQITEPLAPFLYALPMQLFAYALAVAKAEANVGYIRTTG